MISVNVKNLRTRWTKTYRGGRLGLVLVVPLLVGACVLPLPLQVASMVLDGVSYLATQKSLSDHGLSAISGKDCALLRTLTLDPICRERTSGTDVAFVEDWEKTGQEVKTSTVTAGDAPADGRLFYVLGSFDQPNNARELAKLIPDLEPSLLATRAGDKKSYHVIVGPIGPGEKLARQRQIAAAGFYEVRAFAMSPVNPSVQAAGNSGASLAAMQTGD